MQRKKAKTITWGVAALAGVAVVLAALALKGPALEQWYIWKLDSEVEGERITAAERLGQLRPVRAISRLIELLRTENPGRERQTKELHYAAKALVEIGPEAVPWLVDSLISCTDPKRDHAFYLQLGEALTEIGPPAVLPLVGVMRDHANQNVKYLALTVLRRMPGDERVMPAMVAALQDESVSRQSRKTSWPFFYTTAALALGSKPFSDDPRAKTAVPVLIEMLQTDPKKYALTHYTVDECLQRIVFGNNFDFGKGDFGLLLGILKEQLHGEEDRLRKRAASALAWLKEEDVNDIGWFFKRYQPYLK